MNERRGVPVEALRQVAFFRDFDAEALKSIAAITGEKSVPAQTLVFREGEAGDALYIIKSGTVAIRKRSRHETEITLATYGAGEVIGDMSLIDDQPRSASLLTLEDTTLYVIEGSHFQFFLYSHREVTRSTLALLTQRLRRANERMLISALDDHPDMVILTDDQFRITDINKAAQQMLHIVPGRPIDSGTIGKLKVLLGKLRAKAPQFVPLPWILLKPERLYLWIHVNPLKNDQGSVFGYLVELRDVTQDRSRSRRSLEIASFIIQRLPGLVEKLQASEKTSDESAVTEKQQQMLLDALHRQVDKLVAFTELEAGALRIDRDDVHPDDLVRQKIETFQGRAVRKAQVIESELNFGTGLIQGDRDWLNKLLTILLDNAVTYSEAGATITVKTYRTDNNCFGCRIRNPYAGTLSADDCDRLFNVGRQLDEFEQMAIPDYGLDLPLARHIVAAHHGTIEIEPDVPGMFSVVMEL